MNVWNIQKIVKKEYFQNINLNLTDNKNFWKTVEPIFTNKNNTQKIILVENGEVIAENIKTAEIFNDYFVNVAKDLNTRGNIPRKWNERLKSLHLDIIVNDYREHLSIHKINQHFEFKNVNEIQIDNEIKEMNSKKAPGADGIPVNLQIYWIFRLQIYLIFVSRSITFQMTWNMLKLLLALRMMIISINQIIVLPV